jgi:hypothetical protein
MTGDVGRLAISSNGPMICDENNKLPWRTKPFQAKWRVIATAPRFPDHAKHRNDGPCVEFIDANGGGAGVRLREDRA